MGEIFARPVAAEPLEWTGERLTTTAPIQVEVEHLHRYCLARELCRNRDVLDIAAGEGYGTALLAQTALTATGVEISRDAVVHATHAYQLPNLRFLQGDARSIPLADASVDVVVSFETIEHFYEHDVFLKEVRRVLRPGGRLIISSPDRDVYSPPESPANPFHRRELSKQEFEDLLKARFAHVRVLGQRPVAGSAMIADADASVESLTFEKRGPLHVEVTKGLPRAIYAIAVASDSPVIGIPDSIYVETSEVGRILAESGSDQSAQAAALARSELEVAMHERDVARAELGGAYQQRDLARIAARRAAAAAEGHWRGQVAEAERRLASAEESWRSKLTETEHRVANAEHRAAALDSDWRAKLADAEQQLGLLRERSQRADQFDSLLRRLGVRRAAKLIPLSGRRFLAERLFGSPRQ